MIQFIPGRKIRILLLLTLVFIFASCTMMILKMAGYVKNPKLEDSESIISYCKKMHDPYDILWMPDTKQNFDTIVLKRFTRNPTVLIYDKDFNVLMNAGGEGCQKRLINFFNDSTEYEYKKVNDSSYTFLKERTKIIDTKNAREGANYLVVYAWVKWTPKITKDLFERIISIKQSNKFKIQFVSLNKDFQKNLSKKAPKLR